MMKFVVMALLSVALVGCKSKQEKAAQSFEVALETSTGTSWTVVKAETERGQFSVFRNDATGEFVAYNLAKWDRNTMTTLDQFTAAATAGDVVHNLGQDQEWVTSGYWGDVYGYAWNTEYQYDYDCSCYGYVTEWEYTKVGTEWVDTSHWYTFYTGGGFRFNTTTGVSRDLETIAALKEEVAVKYLAFKLKSELSLSENRAQEMARLANRYQRLESTRALTVAEKNTFAMSALGVNMNQVESALRLRAEGRDQQYRTLLQTAARVNSTTPEQIGKFFDEVVGEQ